MAPAQSAGLAIQHVRGKLTNISRDLQRDVCKKSNKLNVVAERAVILLELYGWLYICPDGVAKKANSVFGQLFGIRLEGMAEQDLIDKIRI